ncbi:MAG TPA: ABC transporter permease, partial [Blastocatellia bacterium]|nr:ABC transporter permease [Blastocatellia bacterium]
MDNLIKDIRFGIRRLIKSPGFSLIAIASLALGVGANTAIFSLVNTVLLRPLPVPDPTRIVSVTVRGKGDSIGAFSYPMYEDFRDRNDVLSGILVYRFAYMSLSQDGRGQRVWGYEVSGNYFDVLEVKPVLGRTFLPEEYRTPLSHPVAVMSYGCWQRRFAGDPGVVDRDVAINGHSFRIIGVAPEGFSGTEIIYTPELWVPMQMLEWIEPGSKWLDKRDNSSIFAVGRLKPGVSERQAEQSLNMIAQQLGQEYPDSSEGLTISLIPTGFIIPDLRGAVVGFAWVLMGAVMLVLAVACTNLASLLLARGAERRREIAIRLAIGASRWRLVRQLLTESVLLSVAGGMLGVMLAIWLVGLVEGFKPPVDFPLTVHLALDSRVLVFSLVVSVATGIVFGVAPALQATKTDVVGALKDTAGQAGYRRSRLRSGLVVAQIAVSLVLLIAAGLVIRALRQLQTTSPGFDPNNAFVMSFDVGLEGYDQARGQQFYRQVLDRVRSLPGVRTAALTGFVPLSLNYSGNYIFVEGEPSERGANVPTSMIGAA